MHLVIYFCGTSDEGDSFPNQFDYAGERVRTIFVKGCEQPEVCDSETFPDLKGFAKRFTKKLFGAKENLTTIKDNDLNSKEDYLKSIGIRTDRSNIQDPTSDEEDEKIESITLCGYSRGAVTCFEVAKELDKIVPHIPVNIVANQPVPGNYYSGPGSNVASVADCRQLKNLQNVSIILGAYTGTRINFKDDENTDSFHRGFFSQVVPKLPRTAHRNLIVIPRESHHQVRPNAPSGDEHLHMEVAKILNSYQEKGQEEDLGLVIKADVQRKTEQAKATYSSNLELRPTPYPQVGKLQHFFGLKEKDAYRYIDKLHPAAGLRKGMEWGDQETLLAWWNKHDKKSSYSSSQLTKVLKTLIENTPLDDLEGLKEVFDQATRWLMVKEGTSTSRYYQVESLRNNIFHHLVQNHDPEVSEEESKKELFELNRQALYDTSYFLNHWTRESKNASRYKTQETRDLNTAFEEHAKLPPSEEGDKKLLEALEGWIEAKIETSSKRYDLVVKMAEQLQEVVDNCYGIEPVLDAELSL